MAVRRHGKGWRAVVKAKDPATGRLRYATSGVCSTPTQARREETRLRRERDQGTLALSVRQSVSEFVMAYLGSSSKRRARTTERYSQLLRIHVWPILGSMPLGRVRPADVQRVVDAMVGKALAPRTVRQAIQALSVGLSHAVRLQMIATNPCRSVELPQAHRPETVTPDAAMIGSLLTAAEGSRFYAALVTAAMTGARRGEVLALRGEDVDLDSGVVKINGSLQRIGGRLQVTEPKTKRGYRVVGLPPFAISVLRGYRKDQAERRLLAGQAWNDLGFLFDRGDGRALEPSEFSAFFRSLRAAVGCPKVRLHDLRHGYVSLLVAQGVPVTAIADVVGHHSAAFTMAQYAHAFEAAEQSAKAIEVALGLGKRA